MKSITLASQLTFKVAFQKWGNGHIVPFVGIKPVDYVIHITELCRVFRAEPFFDEQSKRARPTFAKNMKRAKLIRFHGKNVLLVDLPNAKMLE